MLLRIFCPLVNLNLNAAIVQGKIYWKAANFLKILKFSLNTTKHLQTHLCEEHIFKLNDILADDKKILDFNVITTEQVVRLLLKVPQHRRNDSFYKWFLDLKDGVLKFYPESPEIFLQQQHGTYTNFVYVLPYVDGQDKAHVFTIPQLEQHFSPNSDEGSHHHHLSIDEGHSFYYQANGQNYIFDAYPLKWPSNVITVNPFIDKRDGKLYLFAPRLVG